ncbi:MAG: FixH family protein [Paracoccaceae bacterium]
MAELTGRHVAGITVGAFAIIIGVNLTLAYQAVATFPGLEVPNSYVASQEFDAQRAAQVALGWTLQPDYHDGALHLAFTDHEGLPVAPASLNVLVGRPTEAQNDSHPAFTPLGSAYVAPIALNPGKWMLQVEARAANGTLFRQRIDLMVKG